MPVLPSPLSSEASAASRKPALSKAEGAPRLLTCQTAATQCAHRTRLSGVVEFTRMPTDQDLFNELSFYTLSHPSPAFIHQHVVDAFAAQHADEQSKPIATVFALIGLYLHIEKSFTGKQVQRAHMRLARHRKQWPRLEPPKDRGAIGIPQVLAAPPGRSAMK